MEAGTLAVTCGQSALPSFTATAGSGPAAASTGASLPELMSAV